MEWEEGPKLNSSNKSLKRIMIIESAINESQHFFILGMLVNNFLLDRTASSSAMFFSVPFRWIYCWGRAHILV